VTLLSLCLAAALGNAGSAETDTALAALPEPAREPTPRLFASAHVFMGWNPKALVMRGAVFYRDTYIRDANSQLFDKAYWQVGVTADITPALGSYMLVAEWLPMQVLRTRLSYGLSVYHGYVGLQPFDAPDDDWSEPTRLGRDDTAVAAAAQNVRLVIELRLKLWKVVLLTGTELNFYHFHHDSPYVFENWYGLLLAQTDGLYLNRTLLLLELLNDPDGQTVRIGGYVSVRHSFVTDFNNARAGIAFAWEPFGSWWVFERPIVLALLGLHFDDRYRAGTPVFLAGLGSSFDILDQP
jgi:hypothetical protein